MKKLPIILMCLMVLGLSAQAQEVTVRLKDISKIVEARDNQLMGYGIVVGLRGTGDTRAAGLTANALRNLLAKMGVSVAGVNVNSRNAASVMVTADLPAFIKKGQRITVTVSAMGDSTSLGGGTLIMTPLMGPDLRTYVVAQGVVVVNGVNESTGAAKLYQNQATVGHIPNGGIVEAEVPVTFLDQHNITIVLEKPNFYTVSRATKAIQDYGFLGARAIDGNTIKIPLEDLESSDLITTIADIGAIEIVPDSTAKIVLNSKTGTIIIGEKVRLFPVAITHGGISIQINEDAGGLFAAEPQNPIQVINQPEPIQYLNPASTLSSIVNALNQIGASPKDLVSIIQALKESGALIADLEVL